MLRVLMVDDEPDLDFLIQQRFRKHVKEDKLSLNFARNGIEALKFIETLPSDQIPNIVVTDLNMPEMNGLELLIQLKKKFENLDVFIVSAYSDQESVKTAKAAGAKGFLFKPLNFKDLEAIISERL